MSAARLFRSFTATRTVSTRARRRKVLTRTIAKIEPLKAKIAAREPLTDADHRMLAKCGPQTLAYLGYQPRVTLA